MTGIKKETLRKIALVADKNVNISRDSLAQKAEVSSMTVGKAAPMLVEAGLFCESRDPVSRGRHASLLSPSDFFVYLGIFMSLDKITLIAQSGAANEIATVRRAINPSLTCKENISSVTGELFAIHELETRVAMRKTVLLSEKEEFNGFDIAGVDLIFADELIKDALASKFPCENVLYINIADDAIRPLIVSHKNVFCRQSKKAVYFELQKEKAEYISRLIASLSVYSALDRVIVEGEALEENELLFLIKDTLKGKYNFSKKDIPELLYAPKLELLRESLFSKMRKAHIGEICDAYFVEQ